MNDTEQSYVFWVVRTGLDGNKEYQFYPDEEFRTLRANDREAFVNARFEQVVVRNEVDALAWQAAYDNLQEALWTPNQDSRDGSRQYYEEMAARARQEMRRVELKGAEW